MDRFAYIMFGVGLFTLFGAFPALFVYSLSNASTMGKCADLLINVTRSADSR